MIEEYQKLEKELNFWDLALRWAILAQVFANKVKKNSNVTQRSKYISQDLVKAIETKNIADIHNIAYLVEAPYDPYQDISLILQNHIYEEDVGDLSNFTCFIDSITSSLSILNLNKTMDLEGVYFGDENLYNGMKDVIDNIVKYGGKEELSDFLFQNEK